MKDKRRQWDWAISATSAGGEGPRPSAENLFILTHQDLFVLGLLPPQGYIWRVAQDPPVPWRQASRATTSGGLMSRRGPTPESVDLFVQGPAMGAQHH
jgi:hypothetical protein